MERREFIRKTSIVTGASAVIGPAHLLDKPFQVEESWFNRPMRWAQLTLVENDPGHFDPDFWLGYFKKIHADGTTLSAGGVVAYYPTDVPLHHRSAWLSGNDPFGYLVRGSRKMNMSVIARTDPHAVRQDVYDTHPDWIAVTADGNKRRHWANKDLWVTCALGPYNFEFMSLVHKEIMERYQPDGIFSNRWAGHGICYCEHCKHNFRTYAGLELPLKPDNSDKTYLKYMEWSTLRLKELWLLWDGIIRKERAVSRFIPNGFPDKVTTSQLSDIVFTDHQARSGATLPWSNGRVAKELRASIGMKPLGGIFSVGVEEQYRWKDSVQTEAEIRVWVAEGTANGMRPWFTKFSGVLYDKRWLDIVDKIYQVHYRNENYLRNISPIARVGLVFSEKSPNYGRESWQQRSSDHSSGMYHALIEDRMPFEMVNDRLLDSDHLKPFKLLILPNIATMSEKQCGQIRDFVKSGGSIISTFETSLYDEKGKKRKDFGLTDLFGVTYNNAVEGPMQNSYLRIKNDNTENGLTKISEGLEDAYRIINSVHMVRVRPAGSFPLNVTLIPTYPDLPMEDVYPRIPETDIRGVYLRNVSKSRIAYFPGDIDRTFWQIMSADHGRLLRNTIRWALDEEPAAEVQGPGVLDVTCWRQKNSMTVHIVNLTNPMMMKGPFRELIPVEAKVSINLPAGVKYNGVHLLVSGEDPVYETSGSGNRITLSVPEIFDHEIIGIDLV
jgi:hypothetical protein